LATIGAAAVQGGATGLAAVKALKSVRGKLEKALGEEPHQPGDPGQVGSSPAELGEKATFTMNGEEIRVTRGQAKGLLKSANAAITKGENAQTTPKPSAGRSAIKTTPAAEHPDLQGLSASTDATGVGANEGGAVSLDFLANAAGGAADLGNAALIFAYSSDAGNQNGSPINNPSLDNQARVFSLAEPGVAGKDIVAPSTVGGVPTGGATPNDFSTLGGNK
jgi:hypothetical protein